MRSSTNGHGMDLADMGAGRINVFFLFIFLLCLNGKGDTRHGGIKGALYSFR